MRLTRENLQSYGADYEKRREQFQAFVAAVRDLIKSADIPSLSIADETPEELRVQYIGQQYAIRYQYTIGKDDAAIGYLSSYQIDILEDNKYILKAQIEMDKIGNMRPLGSKNWPWSVHNDSEHVFYHLLMSQANPTTQSS